MYLQRSGLTVVSQDQKCVFCSSIVSNSGENIFDGHSWKCPRCGCYEITGTAESMLAQNKIYPSGAVAGWIRHQNSMGIIPAINSDTVPQLRSLTKPTFRERAERYLLSAVASCPRLDTYFRPDHPELVGTSYSDDEGEVAIILRYLTDEKYAEYVNNSGHRITANGFIASEDLRSQRANSSQAFVAMWFATEMDEVYQNGIEPAVVGAGYKPMLIRDKEHANKIDDEIIAEIRRSAFLVADFTGHRGGVYFEAGYAMGRALPVIWLCRKDEISKLHFDIRQYNCIDWNTPEEIFKRLQKRIEARIGQGPKQRQ